MRVSNVKTVQCTIDVEIHEHQTEPRVFGAKGVANFGSLKLCKVLFGTGSCDAKTQTILIMRPRPSTWLSRLRPSIQMVA